ncbi:hypothetical protein [Frankia sp. CIT1]|uniref:hypothetical protein n=1 Tax=Frankia sp. CIT1 TaxID=2880974 RepID=UPI001EF60749|nr:hypothetical protein [Frankia sp. CIT1]
MVSDPAETGTEHETASVRTCQRVAGGGRFLDQAGHDQGRGLTPTVPSDMPSAGSAPAGLTSLTGLTGLTGLAGRAEAPGVLSAGRHLRAPEIVEAAVLVDLVIAICLVARFLPLGWVLTIPAAVPAAVLAARWRLRTASTAIFTAMAVAVLLGGTGFAITITSCMMNGTVLGTAHRRRWGLLRTAAVTVGTLWVPVALVMDALFGVLTQLRGLLLAEIINSWDGARSSIARLGITPDNPGLAAADWVVRWGTTHWWALLPITLLANTAVNVLAAGVVIRPVTAPPRRQRTIRPDRPAEPAGVDTQAQDGGQSAPSATARTAMPTAMPTAALGATLAATA